MPAKKVIHANVSEEAFSSWVSFSAEHGISVTGVVEALGRMGPLVSGKPVTLSQLVKEARTVDGERRRRGGSRT